MKEIISRPIITEKAMTKIPEGRYTFRVDSSANKAEIAKAIADLFKVKVIKVNTAKIKPQEKIVRQKFQAKIKGWKKAIVTLAKGQKIPGFEENK